MSRSVLSENTLVPLGAAIALIAVVVGGVVWLTSLSNEVQAQTERLKEIRQDQSNYMEVIQRIDQRLSRIEGAVGTRENWRRDRPSR